MEKPTELMDAFISLGLESASGGSQLRVVMPTGFVFEQSCVRNETQKVDFRFNGKDMRVKVITNKASKIRLKGTKSVSSSSSPNCVHALDASLLSYIITNSGFDTAVIHDSFASAPADAEDLFRITRESAIELFSSNSIESIFGVDGIMIGRLNLEGILNNEYFCS